MGGYLTEEGARSFSNISYIREASDTPQSRSIFQSGYSDNTYEYIQSALGFDGIRNNLNVGVKASSFLNSNRPNPNGLEMIAATTYLRSQIGLARTSGLPNQQPFGTTHEVISVTLVISSHQLRILEQSSLVNSYDTSCSQMKIISLVFIH